MVRRLHSKQRSVVVSQQRLRPRHFDSTVKRVPKLRFEPVSLNIHKMNPSRKFTRKSRVWHQIGTIKGASSPAEIIFWLAEILISARWWNMNAETLNRIMLQHNWLERNLMWVIYNSMIYTWYSSVLFASVHNIFCYSNTLLKSLIAPWPLRGHPSKQIFAP